MHEYYLYLCRIDPRLLDLLKGAMAVRADSPHFCADSIWRGQFRPRLRELVGRWATDPVLQRSNSYDQACAMILSQLPSCKDCYRSDHDDPPSDRVIYTVKYFPDPIMAKDDEADLPLPEQPSSGCLGEEGK